MIALAAAALSVPKAGAEGAAGWTAFEAGDYAAAEREWRPLALDGNRQAQLAMGLLADLLDRAWEPMVWYRKAAKQGDSTAQVLLGMEYLESPYANSDPVRAYYWFARAAESGHPNAAKLRDELGTGMTPEQVAAAEDMARDMRLGTSAP